MSSGRTIQKSLLAAAIFISFVICSAAQSLPESPVLSGAAGFAGTNNAGIPFWQPVLDPVVLVPIGSRMLIESRADFREFLSRRDGNSGRYQGQFFGTLDYLQFDYSFARSITLVGGRFLTPFGIYNERFTPIWIRNLPDAPLIFPIGTRTSGSSDGAMLRTSFGGQTNWQLNITAFASAGTRANEFEAGRASGSRIDLFLPDRALEFGISYECYLEGKHSNAIGADFSWTPQQHHFQLRSEFAHSNSGLGYWVEAALRSAHPPNSIYGRLQAVARVQQFYRERPDLNDSLPATDATQGDLGLNYYFTHDVRLSSSFGRQFTASRDHNVWNMALTYQFVLPVAMGGRR